MSILKLIANGNFITVNKCVAKSVGLNEAVILGALCSEFVYCESMGRITEDGFFAFSVDALQQETTLGEKPQKVAITNLIKAGVLEQKNAGVPQKRHFRVDEDALTGLLQNRPNGGFKTANREELEPPIGGNLSISNNNSNNDDNKDIVPDSYAQVIDHLNKRVGSGYKTSTRKTKTLIRARFNEGFTVDDFIKVIDKKADEWMGTEMEKYLRPETLFGSKFESYLNQKIVRSKPKFKNFDERDHDWEDIESKLFNR